MKNTDTFKAYKTQTKYRSASYPAILQQLYIVTLTKITAI